MFFLTVPNQSFENHQKSQNKCNNFRFGYCSSFVLSTPACVSIAEIMFSENYECGKSKCSFE